MKTNSILRIFAALIMMMGFAMTTVGQIITASASVVAAVSVTPGINPQFGNLIANTTKTVGNSNNMLFGTVNGGPAVQTGTWTVAKNSNMQVNLTFALASTLTDPISLTTMDITYADYTGPVKLGAIGSVDWTPATGTVQVTNALYSTEYAATTFTVHVGGNVTAGAGQAAGTYTGTHTLTAVYN